MKLAFSGWTGGVVAALWLALPGCGGEEAQAPPAAPRTQAAAPAATGAADASGEAAAIFESRCVTCHGVRGGGDGPASAGLSPTPRNFQDPEWQRSVSDTHIERIIQYGGAAVGRSAAMPGNPDLNGKPEVVAALRQYIRNLGAQ